MDTLIIFWNKFLRQKCNYYLKYLSISGEKKHELETFCSIITLGYILRIFTASSSCFIHKNEIELCSIVIY